MGESLIVESCRIHVQDGEIEDESWVYVWRRPGPPPEVLYVGATRAAPVVRTWLHLHHESPRLGHVRARLPEALIGEVVIEAFRIRAGIDRQEVKHALIALLDGVTPSGDQEDLAWRVAEAITKRLGAHGP